MFGGLIHNALCSGGGGGTVDDRITKINNADTIVNFPLPNGWSIRFKIVFDIVQETYGVYTDPDTSEYIARWIYRYPALFACAYKNGTFMYAANQRHDINYYRIYNTVLAGEKDVLYLQQDFDFGVLPDPDDEIRTFRQALTGSLSFLRAAQSALKLSAARFISSARARCRYIIRGTNSALFVMPLREGLPTC